MEVTAIYLFLWLNSLHSAYTLVSVTVAPNRSQFFKYERFSVSCEGEEGGGALAGWIVMKKMEDGEESPCSSPCSITAAFPATDSGDYWCQSVLGATSNSVNIAVTDGSVILHSPVLPVMEGGAVTLLCVPKEKAPPFILAVNFYKDGLLVSRSSTPQITVHGISRSDEGFYKCNVSGGGESPSSWLRVRAPPAGQNAPSPGMTLHRLVCHVTVGVPYLVSTIILGLIYRDRKKASQARKRQKTNDVIMERVTW
ncbi:Fc receptor-like protein 5 isoform X2 [Genypterus blacodes]|uniref:Fc receptor-like protein 5 isoform X2 n=1 Tax=Genypterus blacodes TaxID=154954 RepID=UPI003F75D4A6